MRAREASGTVLALILGAALVIRVLQARESLWLDELHTAWVAAGTLGDLISRCFQGNQSPLYFWIEWLVVGATGTSELALRGVSLAAGVLLPLAAFFIVRRWTGSAWLGLLPAWLLVLDSQATYYGTEARPYALLQLLAVCHIALVAELAARPSSAKRIAFVAGAALLFHLHFTAALLVIAEFAWLAWMTGRRRTSHTTRALVIDLLCLALLTSPALPELVEIFKRRENWEAFVPRRSLLVGLGMLPWATSALAVTALIAIWQGVRREEPAKVVPADPTLWLALTAVALPLLLAWAAAESNVARLLWPRYIAASAPLATMLLALAIQRLRHARARVIAAYAVAVIAALTSPVLANAVRGRPALDWRTDDWRSAVSHFNAANGHQHGVVLVRTLLMESDILDGPRSDSALVAYALSPVTALYAIDAEPARLIPVRRSDPARIPRTALDRMRSDGVAWLVFGGDADDADETVSRITRELSADAGQRWHVTSRQAFGTVHVVGLERGLNAVRRLGVR